MSATLTATAAALGVAWIGTRLKPNAVRALTHTQVEQTQRAPSLTRSRRTVVWCGIGIIGALVVIGPLGVAVVVLGLGGLRRASPIIASRRVQHSQVRSVPDAIELFVLLVHAGLTPHQAIRELALRAPVAVRPAFAATVSRLERGELLADALQTLHRQIGPAALALVDLVSAADRYGLALAPVLERLADESRSARRRLDEAAARALPVKLAFPLVVCTLPSFVLLAIVPAVLAALSSLTTTSW